MERSTSRRTASPKRRRRSSSSIARSRSSASSSSIARSALRVTRKRWCSRTSIPLNRASRFCSMTWSSRTKRDFSTSSRRGRICGTFTRAKPRSPVAGSRRPTAIERLSVEMYGNGWPGSTASGVRTGIDLVEEALAERLVVLRDGGVVEQFDALVGQRAPDVQVDGRVLRGRARARASGWRRAAPRRCGRRGSGGPCRPRPARAGRRRGPGRTRRGCPRRCSGT